MLVEVKPIDKKTWHGKTGAESFTQPRVLEVLYDSATGAYATGLTPEDVKIYGKRLGVDLSSDFKIDTPHPYWSTQAARIKLPNRTVIFNDEKPSEYVKIKNLKASKFVANSVKELEDGLWPDADFVIFDESMEIEAKATKIQKRDKCIAVVAKMSLEEQIQVVQILGDKTLRGRSQNYVTVEIDKIVDEKPDEFIRIVKMDKQEVYVRATILEAIYKNILTKESAAIYYMGDRIANDYEDAVQWFLDPQNSVMKVTIMEKLNA
jgi:hypothetical protein